MGMKPVRIGSRVAGIGSARVCNRTRQITPAAGHALEILGHAIEYLVDEYLHDTKVLTSTDPQVAAIQLLMSLNRQIYLECPLAATFGERVRAWFQRRNA